MHSKRMNTQSAHHQAGHIGHARRMRLPSHSLAQVEDEHMPLAGADHQGVPRAGHGVHLAGQVDDGGARLLRRGTGIPCPHCGIPAAGQHQTFKEW